VNICFNKHWQLSHEIWSFRAFYSCLCFHCPSFGLPRHYVLNLCIYLCMHAWVCAIVHTYMCASRSILQFACRWLLVSVISYWWLNDVEFCLVCCCEVLPRLLKKCLSPELDTHHGATVALAHVLHALYQLHTNSSPVRLIFIFSTFIHTFSFIHSAQEILQQNYFIINIL